MASNEDILRFMKEISGKFDSLREDVEGLKASGASKTAPLNTNGVGSSSGSGGSNDEAENSSAPDSYAQACRKGKRLRRRANLTSSKSGSSSSARPPEPKRPRDAEPPLLWADRMDSDYEEPPMDYSKEPTWEEDSTKLREVSEETSSLLSEACTSRLSNATRLGYRKAYPLPRVPATRTPQLDAVMKSETSSGVKAADKELAKIQTFMLDALAPLTSLLEEEKQPEQVAEAVKAAVKLIGNANASMSHLRRVKVTKHINEALMPIVQEEGNFKEAPPQLFGSDFAKKAKDHVDQMKAMRASLPKKGRKEQFFRSAPPPRYGRGGGGHSQQTSSYPSRGRGRGRHQQQGPYNRQDYRSAYQGNQNRNK